MKAYFDIIQGTSEWHEIRYGKIGGSSSKGLFVKSDTLLNELVSTKLESFQLNDDDYMSDSMLRGHELEPLARQSLEEYTGIKFITCGWWQSEENELLGISPDGFNQNLTIACEIKCPGAKAHTEILRTQEIPLEYIHQCCHYFTVNPKLKELFFMSFRPESSKRIFVKQLRKESEVNIGTKAKPIIKSILEVVEMAKSEANKLNELINQEVEKILF